MTSSASPRAHADLALAVYLEPHAENRRVLLLGEAQGALADRFDQLASHLEIIDPAAREPSRGEVPELPFDDGSFDLVLVCDVSTLPAPAAGAVRELRRVLSRGGLLAVAGAGAARRRARREPPAHAALEALLAAEFRHVRIIAQTPLSGFALGDLAPQRGEEVTVDSSLTRDARRDPERLLGLASGAPIAAEGRLWIEIPTASADDTAQAPSKALLDELRRIEDEARDALHREADTLRKLEVERRARQEAEQLAERAATFERKLLAAEADYDDAVARVRYFESQIAEHESAARHDHGRIHTLERELSQLKNELGAARRREQDALAERDAARAESEHVAREIDEQERRLVELGQHVRALEADKKAHEETARDLLEELRRLEHDKTASVEHDARVAELEAERDRAVERALEAEVARESALLRADELRAELTAARGQGGRHQERDSAVALLRSDLEARELEVLHAAAEAARQRGEARGLRMRLDEAERALSLAGLGTSTSANASERVASPHSDWPLAEHPEVADLRLRLAHTEANLHAMREARGHARAAGEGAPNEAERVVALEEQLKQADLRLHELTRELEEADRFAELHAEDADRLAQLESEAEHGRDRLDELEDEVRNLEEELRSARVVLSAQQDDLVRAKQSLEQTQGEVTHRIEQAERREAERDDARAALAEARAILSQLAGHVGADENDPPSIVQAVVAHQRNPQEVEHERVIDELRNNLQGRDARIQQLERWLNEAKPEADSTLDRDN